MRTALATLLVLLATAAPAAAAELTLDVGPAEGVSLGGEHEVSGKLTQDGAPMPGQLVTLAARPFPFAAGFTEVDRATTGADGAYSFVRRLDRNTELQVSGAEAVVTGLAAVFPRARLTIRAAGRNSVRLTQTLATTAGVPVTGRTRFYLGRFRAKSARYARSATPRRAGTGRYVARVTLRIPKRFRGRFSYAACFRAAPDSGFGDPDIRCPTRTFRF